MTSPYRPAVRIPGHEEHATIPARRWRGGLCPARGPGGALSRLPQRIPVGGILPAVDLTVLGSAGFVPHEDRETCCALVRDGGAGLLLDAGSGVRRLLE